MNRLRGPGLAAGAPDRERRHEDVAAQVLASLGWTPNAELALGARRAGPNSHWALDGRARSKYATDSGPDGAEQSRQSPKAYIPGLTRRPEIRRRLDAPPAAHPEGWQHG